MHSVIDRHQAKEINEYNRILRESKELKGRLQAATRTYHEIKQLVHKEDAWAWAKAGYELKLDQASECVRVCLSEWQKDWLMMEDGKDTEKDLKKE